MASQHALTNGFLTPYWGKNGDFPDRLSLIGMHIYIWVHTHTRIHIYTFSSLSLSPSLSCTYIHNSGAVDLLVNRHHYVPDRMRASATTTVAGVDIDCAGGSRLNDAFGYGLITQGRLDQVRYGLVSEWVSEWVSEPVFLFNLSPLSLSLSLYVSLSRLSTAFSPTAFVSVCSILSPLKRTRVKNSNNSIC